MKVYEVGGCVRDRLLGLDPKDIDYVVVGSTPEAMTALGYEQVGADFPVFLHPETKDEYALARREVKTGAGYNGFTTDTKNVSLEEDLFRRDLTINAMALDKDGTLIDLFNGKSDLENGLLRHVSSHFSEDPVRLLRIARFAARYDFSIAPETNTMLREMVANGEIDSLKKERVWLELNKTLNEKHVNKFFESLTNSNACEKVFPFAEFPHPERFSEQNTQRDNLLIIFAQMTAKQLKNFDAPAYEKEIITIYKKFFDEGKVYSEMEPEGKIIFIKSVKALHKEAQDPEIVNNIFSHIKRFKNPNVDIEQEMQIMENDLLRIRNHPFDKISKEFAQQNPKGNIGIFMKEEYIKVVAGNSLQTLTPKFKH